MLNKIITYVLYISIIGSVVCIVVASNYDAPAVEMIGKIFIAIMVITGASIFIKAIGNLFK